MFDQQRMRIDADLGWAKAFGAVLIAAGIVILAVSLAVYFNLFQLQPDAQSVIHLGSPTAAGEGNPEWMTLDYLSPSVGSAAALMGLLGGLATVGGVLLRVAARK